MCAEEKKKTYFYGTVSVERTADGNFWKATLTGTDISETGISRNEAVGKLTIIHEKTFNRLMRQKMHDDEANDPRLPVEGMFK